MNISRQFIESIPKTDLHLHLDGSIRIPTLIELAKEYDIKLPSYTEEGLKELVFKEKYSSLPDYLQGFGYTVAVMQSESSLERIAYELAVDNQLEGVRYIEVRFAPQLHQHRHLSVSNVLKSVNRGLRKAKDEFNSKESVKSGEEPPFEYGIIVCAMRMFMKGMSEFFDNILSAHTFSNKRKVFSLASEELVLSAIDARDKHNLPIVGVDLAGAEDGFPAEDHKAAFQLAHRNFLKKTVHAGEAYGPESIFQAITDLHADRIGHGFYLFEADMVKNPDIKNKNKFVEDLTEFIADRRITIEVCLTSNMQTNPKLKKLEDHSFAKMRKAKLSATFCTDNRTVSMTSVSDEIEKAVKAFNITPKELRNHVIYGFKRSFFPQSYQKKREYVRQIIDYYEKVEKQFNINSKNTK